MRSNLTSSSAGILGGVLKIASQMPVELPGMENRSVQYQPLFIEKITYKNS